MARENFLADGPWEEREELGLRTHAFWRPDPGWLQFGASLIELDPGSPGHKLHLHYGSEEMFFVVSGTPARIIGVSAGRFPDVVAYPEHGYAWLATRDPEFPAPKDGDPGIIARFDLPEAP
jgi:hypothetical protein